MLDLLDLTRDPCTCAPRYLCAPCKAWDLGDVLVGGKRVASVALWCRCWRLRWYTDELATWFDEEFDGRTTGRWELP